jgi:hypothetical protein
VTAGESKYHDYEAFARAYARNNKANPFNVLYGRPAIMSLAATCAGCGCSMPGADPACTPPS